MLATVVLLACGSNESDSLGDCPPDPGGDPGAWLDVETSRGHLGDLVVEGQLEVFHDVESMDTWWESGVEGYPQPSYDLDFSEVQAVGLVTEYQPNADEGLGERIEAIQWSDAERPALVARVRHECNYVDEHEAASLLWVLWVTPIFPITRCDLPKC